MNLMQRWKSWAKILKFQAYVLYYSYRDPETPLFAKIFAAIVTAYAFSPIDLIPDFIPILGYLDDLILIPLGVALVIRLIPAEVLKRSREKAANQLSDNKPVNWIAGGIILTLWIAVLAVILYWILIR